MKDKIFSEKEIAIFNGLISLMKKGANPYSIKVSDIAEAANIGKGTIYDYFDTKEEVISKAIIYNMTNEIKNAFRRIENKDNFRDKLYEVLDIIEENLGNKLSTLNILLSAGGIEKFYEYLLDSEYNITEFIALINRKIRDILNLGIEEGVINTEENSFYQIMAVHGVISFFSHYINQRDLYLDIGVEEAKDTAYRMLLKALN
ncbi:MAG: TetR/AcrR family transcriptional regulator [Tissierellia bacterium]|nr:TetR/AcrR family transcriptional regulator [Tissierellia bacterium]